MNLESMMITLRRIGAYCLDCAILFAFYAGLQLLVMVPIREAMGIDFDWFKSGIQTQLYTMTTISLPAWIYFALGDSGTGGSFWTSSTIGKKLFGLQVVGCPDGQPIGLRTAFLRTALKLLPWELAHLANNLPTPIWFEQEPSFRSLFVAVNLVLVGYGIALFRFGGQQTLYDLLLKTQVNRILPNDAE